MTLLDSLNALVLRSKEGGFLWMIKQDTSVIVVADIVKETGPEDQLDDSEAYLKFQELHHERYSDRKKDSDGWIGDSHHCKKRSGRF